MCWRQVKGCTKTAGSRALLQAWTPLLLRARASCAWASGDAPPRLPGRMNTHALCGQTGKTPWLLACC